MTYHLQYVWKQINSTSMHTVEKSDNSPRNKFEMNKRVVNRYLLHYTHQKNSMLLLWSARNDKITSLHHNKVDCKLTLSTLTWTCTLSILFPMYFLLRGDEENLFYNQELLSSDHSPYSPVLNGWFQGDILGRNHSCRC